jgi:hypothetical protein
VRLVPFRPEDEVFDGGRTYYEMIIWCFRVFMLIIIIIVMLFWVEDVSRCISPVIIMGCFSKSREVHLPHNTMGLFGSKSIITEIITGGLSFQTFEQRVIPPKSGIS